MDDDCDDQKRLATSFQLLFSLPQEGERGRGDAWSTQTCVTLVSLLSFDAKSSLLNVETDEKKNASFPTIKIVIQNSWLQCFPVYLESCFLKTRDSPVTMLTATSPAFQAPDHCGQERLRDPKMFTELRKTSGKFKKKIDFFLSQL